MKDCNICDDNLINKITAELIRFGVILPVSEIERLAISSYDSCLNIHKEDSTVYKLDATQKNNDYYECLACFVCVEALAEARLLTANNGYEAASVLNLIQSYLDRIATVTKTQRKIAAKVFGKILDKLDFTDMSIEQVMPENSSDNADDQDNPFDGITIIDFSDADYKENNHICNNVLEDGPFLKCDYECGDCEACTECVSLTISHRGICFGVRVDPVILSLDKPITNNKGETEERLKVFKNFLNKANKEFKDSIALIYSMLCVYHTHFGDSDDD